MPNFITDPKVFKDFVGISPFGHIVFLLNPYKNLKKKNKKKKIFSNLPSLF